MKVKQHYYGASYVINKHDKVVRVYFNKEKNMITVDLSQVQDINWKKYKLTIAKYGLGKIKITGDQEKVDTICKYFNEEV